MFLSPNDLDGRRQRRRSFVFVVVVLVALTFSMTPPITLRPNCLVSSSTPKKNPLAVVPIHDVVLSQPLTSALSLSSSILSLRRPCLVVHLDSIEPNGGLLWSSSDASSAGKINAQSIFSKPLKIFACYISTIHGGASSRGMDEQYHICGVVSFFFHLGVTKMDLSAKRDPAEVHNICFPFFSPSIV